MLVSELQPQEAEAELVMDVREEVGKQLAVCALLAGAGLIDVLEGGAGVVAAMLQARSSD